MTKFSLGIDIGGSKVKSVILSDSGARVTIYEGFTYPTPRNRAAFLRALEQKIHIVLTVKRISGIGVGIAGIVEAKRGVLVKAPNLAFLNNWNARQFFSKFHVPVAFDNDSRCFVRAEALYGAGQGYKNIAGLAVGTGIGGGIIVNGRVYRGAHGSAGEFGHTIINIGNPSLLLGTSGPSIRLGTFGTLESLGGKRAFERLGDRSKIVGIGVANIINALDPDIVILGGGAITTGGVKLPAVRQIARKYILSPLARRTSIVKGKLGESAQAIGAVLLVVKNFP